MNAKEYYCYGFLEKYGYNINGKITRAYLETQTSYINCTKSKNAVE